MSEGSEDPVHVGTAKVLRESAKALLIDLEGESVWIPKSIIHDDSEVWNTENGEGELVVKAWFARKEGWE